MMQSNNNKACARDTGQHQGQHRPTHVKTMAIKTPQVIVCRELGLGNDRATQRLLMRPRRLQRTGEVGKLSPTTERARQRTRHEQKAARGGASCSSIVGEKGVPADVVGSFSWQLHKVFGTSFLGWFPTQLWAGITNPF